VLFSFLILIRFPSNVLNCYGWTLSMATQAGLIIIVPSEAMHDMQAILEQSVSCRADVRFEA
jgi:hypothetical protein